MRIGIHLPQFGRAIEPGGIQTSARAAEALGFDDLWVSDHLVVPKEQTYPPAYLLDPLQTLAFAAAATETIGIGTSVLVGPQYPSALQLANTLASLDYLSSGRLTLGIAVGWSQREYEALGVPFEARGHRLDEMIRLFRTVWENDPADFEGSYYPSFRQIRVLPPPAHRIPIWIGGSSNRALDRALRNDGYHVAGVPDDAQAFVHNLRAARPDKEFVVSTRLNWNVGDQSVEYVAEQAQILEEAGFGAILICPDRGEGAGWLTSQENLAEALIRSRR